MRYLTMFLVAGLAVGCGGKSPDVSPVPNVAKENSPAFMLSALDDHYLAEGPDKKSYRRYGLLLESGREVFSDADPEIVRHLVDATTKLNRDKRPVSPVMLLRDLSSQTKLAMSQEDKKKSIRVYLMAYAANRAEEMTHTEAVSAAVGKVVHEK